MGGKLKETSEISRQTLEKLSRQQLLDLCWKQERMISKMRGHDGGMTREKMEVIDSDVLIDCYLSMQESVEEASGK